VEFSFIFVGISCWQIRCSPYSWSLCLNTPPADSNQSKIALALAQRVVPDVSRHPTQSHPDPPNFTQIHPLTHFQTKEQEHDKLSTR